MTTNVRDSVMVIESFTSIPPRSGISAVTDSDIEISSLTLMKFTKTASTFSEIAIVSFTDTGPNSVFSMVMDSVTVIASLTSMPPRFVFSIVMYS